MVDRRDLLTVKEFAELAGVSERTIYRYIKHHLIQVYKIGPKALRIHRNQLDKLITKQN